VLTIIDHQRENMQLLHFVFLGVVTSPSLSLMCNWQADQKEEKM
jgi:hypothetical protein